MAVTIKDAYESIVETVEAGEEGPPSIIFETEDGKSNIIALMYDNDIEKKNVLRTIRLLFLYKEVKEYIFVAEAWKSYDPKAGRPVDDPKREEIVTAMKVSHDKVEIMEGVIHREEDGRIWVEEEPYIKEEENIDNVSGAFMGLLPPKDLYVPPWVKDELKELFDKMTPPTKH